MLKYLLLLFSFLIVSHSSFALNQTAEQDISGLSFLADELNDFPIFGKKKTSNKKQRKYARKGSRRNGKGVMRARKNKGKNNGRSVKGGSRGKRGSKKKAGCNT